VGALQASLFDAEEETPPQAQPVESTLVPHTKVGAIVGARDAAVEMVRQAAWHMAEGRRLALAAEATGSEAHGGFAFTDVDHAKQAACRRLFEDFDADASIEAFRKHLDARTWMRLISLAGIRDLMDRTARDALYKDLCGSVPEVTVDAVRSVLEDLAGDARLIFLRGLARAFIDLDRRFKSHDGFALGSRIVLTRIFDEYGFWNYHNSAQETLADVERVFAVLDGNRAPNVGALRAAIEASRRRGACTPQQSFCETPYFRVRTYMNGNVHLWFTRDDLVARANEMLAEFYGAVMPDGVPGEGPEADLQQSTRAISRDLAFYPTPEAVVRLALRHMDIGPDDEVLEPSAGEGNMVRVILETGARVTAIEVDERRHRALGRIRGRMRCVLANFLRLASEPRFTHVVMNPPFYGLHWIAHVVHAYSFLAPGGELVAVLPATAEVGSTRKHEEFRAWAEARAHWSASPFTSLPMESFSDSGTRVSTVLLRLRKEKS
jgi:hypothetical protein